MEYRRVKLMLTFAVLGTLVCACKDDQKETTTSCKPMCKDESTVIKCIDNEEILQTCQDDKKCYEGVCQIESSENCTDNPTECVNDWSYHVCAWGHWSKPIECEEKFICDGGRCIPKNACEIGKKVCTDDNSGYRICEGDSNQVGWSNDIDCPDKTVCQDGNCVPVQPQCNDSETKCSADNKGYHICNDGKWSDVIECIGTATCNGNKCSGEDTESKLPCGEVGKQKCLSNNRVQVCGPDKYWFFMDCPEDIPICDATQNECVPKCTSKNQKCLSETEAYQCTNTGEWKTVDCEEGFCLNGDCVECREDDTECADDYHSLKTCKNGHWTLADCYQISGKEHCPLGGKECIRLFLDESCCDPSDDSCIHPSFSYCSGGGWSGCGYKANNATYYGSAQKGFLSFGCSGECFFAEDGIGASCVDSGHEGERCTKQEIGQTIRAEANSGAIIFSPNSGKIIAYCAMCKRLTNGDTFWVGVDASYCNENE